MRNQTILPILLLPLAAVLSGPASAQSLPYATVATVPANPTPGDPVVLKLSGMWPDSCVPQAPQAKLTQDGTNLRVILIYSGFSGACAAVVTSWALDVPAGELEAGSYQVQVDLVRTLLPAETIGTGSFVVAAQPEADFWVPGFSANGSVSALASTLTGFNNSASAADVTPLGAWDALGARPSPVAPATIPPGEAASFDTRQLRAGQAVQMLAFRAPVRVTFRATLERLENVPEGLPKTPAALGRVELPVFTDLFPAGMTAVAGDISFSAEECAAGATGRRRVNLTLFNAGDAPATFVVDAPNGKPEGSAWPKSLEVPAGTLVQFNDVPTEGLAVCETGGAFLSVTADQPFLAYVSTSRPETAAGILPYEVFPARLQR